MFIVSMYKYFVYLFVRSFVYFFRVCVCFFSCSLQFNDSFSRSYDHGNSTTMVLNNCDEDGD